MYCFHFICTAIYVCTYVALHARMFVLTLSLNFYRYTLAFTFGALLQADLDAFVEEWNAHPIRKNRHAPSPHGRPNDMYDMPTLYGKK